MFIIISSVLLFLASIVVFFCVDNLIGFLLMAIFGIVFVITSIALHVRKAKTN